MRRTKTSVLLLALSACVLPNTAGADNPPRTLNEIAASTAAVTTSAAWLPSMARNVGRPE